MAVLKFKKTEVKKLIDHTLQNPKMSPSLIHLAESQYWKPHAKASDFGFVKASDVDVSKIEPYLSLVKDSGIYLMSGSSKTLPGTTTMNYVVYAEGYGEDADYDDIVAAADGDDFGETIELSAFQKAMEMDGKYLTIILRSNDMLIGGALDEE